MAVLTNKVASKAPRGEGIDVEDRRNLLALQAIDQDAQITQRSLSAKLGMALGLTNIYLRRLVRKGYVKCVNVQSNRLRYLLTPAGITEKTRLTYEFMEYSLFLYGQVRQHLRGVLEAAVRDNRRRVAVYGNGEAAELAYLSITELGLQLVAVFNDEGEGRFLGHTILRMQDHRDVEFDLLLIASLENSDRMVEELTSLGVARDRLVLLRD